MSAYLTSQCQRHALEGEILHGVNASRALHTALRELLSAVEASGRPVDIHSLAERLATFTPSLPVERAEEWQIRAQQHWLGQTKPALIECLADYFIR
ncbi:hypothetical protein [Pseudomonas sediminis]|uniref:Uncharacterized protein n=1 Tax=Pseudomonas sediminis TaxID=1691904 RepID=A0A2G5FD51_9PSED|nr:hypothetical protein [Pseudomonas sediminis]PIA65892.1 hypothetical protein CDO35_21795 [Pseudomonas sediminis]